MRALTDGEKAKVKSSAQLQIDALNKLQESFSLDLRLFFTKSPHIVDNDGLGSALKGPVKIARNVELAVVVFRKEGSPFAEKDDLNVLAGLALMRVLKPAKNGYDPHKRFRKRYQQKGQGPFLTMINEFVRLLITVPCRYSSSTGREAHY